MAGTRAGGLKAKEKNLASNPDFYRIIGAKGGRNGNTGGFAAKIPCNCPEYPFEHLVRECAGVRGGRKSRRGKGRLEPMGYPHVEEEYAIQD